MTITEQEVKKWAEWLINKAKEFDLIEERYGTLLGNLEIVREYPDVIKIKAKLLKEKEKLKEEVM